MTTGNRRPPIRTERLLAFSLRNATYAEDIIGDLREAYADLADTRGVRRARWWYRGEALRLIARYGLRTADRGRRRSFEDPGGTLMDRILMDVRFAVRSLAKRKAMSLAVVVTLALGIGANSAVFGVIDALLLHPFAMRDVDRIVMPVTTTPRWSDHRETVSNADFLDWRRNLEHGSIDRLSAFEWWDANLVGRDEPERVLGFFVSPSFFDLFDAHASVGRTFVADEEVPANAHRVVLSEGLWKRMFGGDPGIVGRAVRIDAASWTVVGVMPASFNFPMRSELWAPLAFDEKAARDRTAHNLTVLGRLAPGRSLSEADAQMQAIVARINREHPDTNAEFGVKVFTLNRGMTDIGLPAVLGLWQAAGLFVLLIACANIANLLLARAAEREREIAIRLALGSSRGRVLRESLVESGLLVVMSMPLALAVASLCLHVMHAFMPGRIVRYIAGWDRLGLQPWTIGAAFACAAVAAVIFGVAPAAHMARGFVADALKSDGRSGAGPGRQRVRRALVVAEISLALPLLVAAMLSLSTVTRYLTGWQGYDPSSVLTMRVILPATAYPDAASRGRYVDRALDELSAVAGVRDAAAGNLLPAMESNAVRAIEVAGKALTDRAQAPRVNYRTASPKYFDVLRVSVTAGRAFTDADQKTAEPVAIVSESMARKFWPSGAVGERLRIGDGPWMRVVGVCGDVVHDWFDGVKPTMYVPLAQAPGDVLAFAMRTNGDPQTAVAEVRAAMTRVDPAQPVFDLMPMRKALSDRTISLQYIATVMAAFAGLALLLALLGLYAVMTYLVTQRVREIGVRIALGATERDVTRLTMSQAGRLTAMGIGIGLALAAALARGMEAGLLGIVSNDFRLTLAIAVALAAAALAASYLPARRAAGVDPIVALRSE